VSSSIRVKPARGRRTKREATGGIIVRMGGFLLNLRDARGRGPARG
jgi:hypothetical protein